MELPPLVQKIIADVSSYEKGLNAAGQAIKRFQTRAASVEQFGRTIGSGMVEGIDKIRAAWDSASAAAMRYASAFQNLNLASASSNMAANLAKQAEALKQITGSPAAMARFAGTAYSKGRLAIDPDEAGRYAVQALREQISVQTKATVGAMGRVRVPLPMAGGPGRIATPLMDTVRQAVQGSQEALATGSAFQTQQQSMKGFSRRLAEGARSASRAARPEEIMEVFGMSPQGLRAAATAADLSFSTELGKIRSAVGRGGGKKGATAGNMAEVFGLPGPGAHLPANLSPAALNVLGSYVDPDRAAARSMRTPDGAGGGGLFGKGGALKGLASRVASGFFLFSEFRQTIDALKEGVNQYVVAMVHAHAEMATSAVQGLHSAASGFVKGFGRALDGFVDAIRTMLTSGDLSAQVGGAGGLLGDLVGAVGDVVGGAISGAGQTIQGAITAQMTRKIAGIQLGGGIGQAAGHGASLVGGAALAGGLVGGPIGLGTVVIGQAIAAGSQIIANYLSEVEKASAQVLQTIASMATGIASEIVGVVGGLAAKMIQLGAAITSGLISAGVEAQKLATTLGVLTGDTGKGRALFSDLQNMTLISPYSLSSLNEASQILIGMGMNAKDVTAALKVMGDVAVGDEGRLKNLATIFAEAGSLGGLTERHVRRLSPLGVNESDLAKAAGLNKTQFQDRLKHGLIPLDVLRQTLNQQAGPGGRKAGEMEQNLGTAGGRWTQLSNTVGVVSANMGEAFNKAADFAGTFKSLADTINGMSDSLVEFARKVGSYIGPIVKEFLELSGAVAKTVVEMVKMSGVDLGKPAELAKTIGDAFLGGARAIAQAGAAIGTFIAKNLEAGIIAVRDMLLDGIDSVVQFLDSYKGLFLSKGTRDSIKGDLVGASGRGGVYGLINQGLTGAANTVRRSGIANSSAGWAGNVTDFFDRVQGNRGWLDGGMPNMAQVMGVLPGPLKAIVGSVNRAVRPFSPIAPSGMAEWENEVNRRILASQSGHQNLADRLANANARGSEGAYETFAHSFAQQQSPGDPITLLQEQAKRDDQRNILLGQIRDRIGQMPADRQRDLVGVEKPKPAGVQP